MTTTAIKATCPSELEALLTFLHDQNFDLNQSVLDQSSGLFHFDLEIILYEKAVSKKKPWSWIYSKITRPVHRAQLFIRNVRAFYPATKGERWGMFNHISLSQDGHTLLFDNTIAEAFHFEIESLDMELMIDEQIGVQSYRWIFFCETYGHRIPLT